MTDLISPAALERELAARLAARLDIDPSEIDPREPFESYGLASAEAISLSGELEEWLGRSLPPTLFYTYPTVEALARHLSDPDPAPLPAEAEPRSSAVDEPICVVGLGCRFPGGASGPEAFWQLLRDGLDGVSEVPADRWDVDAYYDPDPDAPQKMYTRRAAFLPDLSGFDAAFFGISPREALRMDPQQRLLLEVAWEALEHAGQAPDRLAGSRTGVFVGMMSEQQYLQLQVTAEGQSCLDDPYFGMGSAASVAAGRLAYLLDLRGPALTVDTACSSSLVAAHLACQSLRSGECDLALVGGVNAITLPESMVNACKMRMLAVDGRCKTFDATADGFALGEGCGVVVLERLSDAVASGHRVLAVIRGSAVNQDGLSNGLTAPNKTSQVDVIRRALASAKVSPGEVGYVEAHGSGTLLGDAIEIEALGEALGHGRPADRPLAIGAVKTNVGHLAGAAGMAGLIKTVLILRHGEIPPNLNLARPNPTVAASDWPMVMPASRRPWPAEGSLRLAGVSSFGWSGTNAHLVLEEAPPAPEPEPAGDSQILLLSAETPTALAAARARLLAYMKQHPSADLGDVAYTSQVGRSALRQRQAIVCRDRADALRALESPDSPSVLTGTRPRAVSPVAFMLPGLGDQYPGMGREVYRTEPVFRHWVDRCAELLLPELRLDLRDLLFPPQVDQRGSSFNLQPSTFNPSLTQTALAQPAQFVVDYALARLWQSWGVQPEALIGYSLGEYVAACLADVFTLEDALRLVARRARLIETLPPAGMLAVALSEAELRPLLTDDLSLAAVNGPATCVVAGPTEAVADLERRLGAAEVACRRMRTAHPFHSPLLAPIAEDLAELVRSTSRQAPRIRFVSNVTGTWITAEQATDPAYWVAHMLGTVRFADGLAELCREAGPILLEVGPGQTLGSFALQLLPARGIAAEVLASMPAGFDPRPDREVLLRAAGRLWLAGVELHWPAIHAGARRQLLSMPTYPFEHQRFWIDPPTSRPAPGARPAPKARAELRDWFYTPTWRERARPVRDQAVDVAGPWLLFVDEHGLGSQLAARLAQRGLAAVQIRAGDQFAQDDQDAFTIRPSERADYVAVLTALRERGQLPAAVAHLWTVTGPRAEPADQPSFDGLQELGFYSLLCLAQALDELKVGQTRITVVSDQMQAVDAADRPRPEKATLLGPCKVIPQEYPQITCRSLDIESPGLDAEILDELVGELTIPCSDLVVAYRRGARWVQTYEPTRLDASEAGAAPLRPGGVYLITGGLGGIGLALAGHLARTVGARLVLTGRSGLPPRAEWDDWLGRGDEASAGLPGPTGPGTTVARRIGQVRALEALGSEVLVLPADVASPADMERVVAQAVERFGRLDGVVHAAGLVGSDAFKAIRDLDRRQSQAHFQPKAHGLLVLERALRGQQLDFCFLLSSLSAVLGGLGFAAYSAANAFMDAFAERQSREGGRPWISVNWDTWQLSETMPAGALGATLAAASLTPEEGVDAFARVMASRATRLIVSTGDLEARIRQWLTFEAPAGQPAGPAARPALFPRPALADSYAPATSDRERRLADLWCEALGVEQVGVNDNFFDLGGNSLIGMQLISRVKKEFDVAIPAVALFEAPTVAALARYLAPPTAAAPDAGQEALARRRKAVRRQVDRGSIAIVGLAGRFPGADSVEQLWENLKAGRESITFFSEEELLAAGVDPRLLANPSYVKARPIVSDIDQFDAAFFGYSPREAQLADPQQRLFLECAWEALGNAGYAPQSYKGLVGVFAGSNISTYLLGMLNNPAIVGSVNDYQVIGGNDKDALTTTVSYKLNLRGPSMAVQTFCSTSLVATHQACQSLLAGECDMAVAGGVSLRIPQRQGYLYSEGGQESPDGHVRSFDARAGGAIFGDGVGAVVLKRLDDALEDGDHVYAVIKGSAVNNDGSLKVGYTAPSVAGQSEAVARALEVAGVTADTIGYVEAHGSATELGDPIEVAALTRAFQQTTDRTGYCAIGSVKSNVGHLDRAAGVTGLIKAALCLRHGQIPPTVHFESPNPQIDFENSPFYVSARLADWPRRGAPRRAGVNSLGMGGTNVHAVLEEAPAVAPTSSGRPLQLLPLSARSAPSLDALTERLAEHLGRHPELPLADVAYTLQVGRRGFDQRRVVLAADAPGAVAALVDPARRLDGAAPLPDRPVAFLLPGVGDHFVGMGRALYEHEPVFRDAVDRCCELLRPELGLDLRALLYPADAEAAAPTGGPDLRALLGRGPSPGAGPLTPTALAQPAVFVVEYALAELLTSWGIRPWALIGYSLGEYVAACLAGVFSLEDALRVVATRARLIGALPPGSMLAVALPEAELRPRLGLDLDLAAINGPGVSVVAGPPEAVAALEADLAAAGVVCRRLETTHAFHSRMMAPAALELEAWLRREVSLRPPSLPYVSNVTGTWVTPEQATDPAYWARHLREAVRFGDGVATLLAAPEPALLEVGPGQGLGAFARQHPACGPERLPLVLGTLGSAAERRSALEGLLTAAGKLWLSGVEVDWTGLSADERRQRVPLPTYVFDRQRFWIEPTPVSRPGLACGAGAGPSPDAATDPAGALARLPRQEPDDWFYLPGWRQAGPPRRALTGQHRWLLFDDERGVGQSIGQWLLGQGQDVVHVRPGSELARLGPDDFALRPREQADYAALLRTLQEGGRLPDRVVHLWTLGPGSAGPLDRCPPERTLDLGFHSLVCLAQVLGGVGVERCPITVVTAGSQNVGGADAIDPAVATIAGPCKVIPLEYPALPCRSVDVILDDLHLPSTSPLPLGAASRGAPAERVGQGQGEGAKMGVAGTHHSSLDNLLAELAADPVETTVALRGGRRWLPSYERIAAPEAGTGRTRLREQGVYLITGGLGGLGQAVAAHLARTVRARLVLTGRSGLPPRDQWPRVLAEAGDAAGPGRQIRQVEALEALGAEVLVVAADVTRLADVEAAVGQALARFGRLDGVVHAAGVPGAGLMQFKTPELAEQVLAPKVQGTLALAQALRDLRLDFLVLFSSISSITSGGPGQVDYCAANAFLDAFAQGSAGRHGLTAAINWSEWQWNAWDDALGGHDQAAQAFLRETRARFGISAEEGVAALERSLALGLPQVVVATQDFPSIVDLSRHFSVATLLEQARQTTRGGGVHPRPTLAVSYVAPTTDVERKIAATWGEALGIAEVGVNDSFFDLGGNSLIGLDLIARLRRELDAPDLAPHVLYEAPTVRALARLLEADHQPAASMDDRQERGERRRASLQQRRMRQ